MKRRGTVVLSMLVVLVWGLVGASAGNAGDHEGKKTDDPPAAVNHDVSPPLRDIAAISESGKPKKAKEDHAMPLKPVLPAAPDPVLQSTPGTATAPPLGSSFEGVGQSFPGFTVTSAPPDPNGAVGPNNYVQIVNQSFAIFNKSGTVLYGPAATNTLFTGFGG